MSSTDPGKLTDQVSLGTLTRIIPRYVVDEVLAATGKREKRSRTLPAHVVVYFVLALSLFTDGYEEVIRKLVNGLRFARTWSRDWTVPTTGALSAARSRLGEAPMRALYERIAVPVAKAGTPGAWLRQWRVMAIDGVMIDMPDSAANRKVYGNRPDDHTPRPFPQIRTLALAEVGTHAVVAITTGTIYQGERDLAEALTSHIEPDMLITADRGFYSFELFRHYMSTGCQLLWRLPSTVILPVLTELPDGSYLSEIHPAGMRNSRTRIPADKVDDIHLATHIPVRVIEYQIDGHTDEQGRPVTYRLITTILDPEQATATELAAAYHERWEEESAFREIEIYLRSGKGIRSKLPELVRQELYGLFLTHYAVRAFMTEAADTVEIDSDRLSFTRTLHIIRRRITDPAALSPLRQKNTP